MPRALDIDGVHGLGPRSGPALPDFRGQVVEQVNPLERSPRRRLPQVRGYVGQPAIRGVAQQRGQWPPGHRPDLADFGVVKEAAQKHAPDVPGGSGEANCQAAAAYGAAHQVA